MNGPRLSSLVRPGWLVLAALASLASTSVAQEPKPATVPGQFFTIRDPISTETLEQIRSGTRQILQRHAKDGVRPVLVFEFLPSEGLGRTSGFGSSYELATFLSTQLSGASTVAFVPRPLEGYAVLPALACDELVLGEAGSIGSITPSDQQVDPSLREPLRSLAQRKGKAPDLILGLLDRDSELKLVRTSDKQLHYVPSAQLDAFRRDHDVVEVEDAWEPGRRGVLTATQARARGVAQLIANARPEVASAYRLAGQSASEDPTLGQEIKPLWVRLQGPIDSLKRGYFRRRIDQARREGINLLLLQMDSLGGEDSEADAFADLLGSLTDIKTIAFIDDRAIGVAALLPLACHEIVFKSGGVMGDMITARRRNRAPDDLRIQSLSRRAANLAERRGHPPAVAVAMADPSAVLCEAKDSQTGARVFVLESQAKAEPGRYLGLEIRKEAGQALTLKAEEAKTYGIAQVVVGEDDLKRLYGLEGKAVLVDAPSWVDSLVSVLTEPLVSWLLLFVGLFMLVVELKLPGIGLPAITSALAFILFFWSHYLAGTADQLEIILFLVGMICLALELFVFPGFGVFGMSGILLILGSIVMASHTFVWPSHEYEYREMGQTLLQVLMAMACVGGGAAILGRYFPSLPLFNRLVLRPEPWSGFEDPDAKPSLEGYTSMVYLIGETGRATTVLRPTGKAKFGDQLLDVITTGAFIEPGSLVEVVEVQGARIIVKAAEMEGVYPEED